MARQSGRISGGVLKDNLLRQGVDLKFSNESGDPSLLHLDVNNNKININEAPATDTLNIADTLITTRLVGTSATVAAGNYFTIDTSEISALGDINIDAGNNIFATSIATDDLKFDFNRLITTTPDTDIELRPNSAGEVNIRSNWFNDGNIHATGDITFQGTLTLGDDSTDSVDFEAEVQSDIVPDVNDTSSLGSATKKWLDLYTTSLYSGNITGSGFELDGVNLELRQGNTFYVSTLGNDSNVGDHQHGAFRTLKHALEVADASTFGPVIIHIYPGEYVEEFPLTVPQNVTIAGEDLRNTIIKPTPATQTHDAFLIDDGCTVENITIKDFYFNPSANTGHAFRFTPNGTINNRSPYVRNVTVITKGTTVTANDPRGFDSGNAGKGAYIDGSELDADSLEASMLFHSVTFITPGVDAVTMTNGVRVEWLNSFTYYANRGLYATQGTIGKALSDSSMRYGAELRSIGSANVYGNYGAVADGANTLMYLIGHNFAYIGTGKDKSNDGTLVLQSNETTEINFGKIYYTSTDAFGTYRVGDLFYVDFETGTTSLDASNVNFAGVGSIVVRNGNNVTYIDGERIDTGNIRIRGNTIDTIDEDLILAPSTGILNINTNTGFRLSNGTNGQRDSAEGGLRYNTDLDLFEGFSTANVGFNGVYSDDSQTNLYATDFSNEIEFNISGNYVGTVDSTKLSIHGLSDGDVLFDDNTITTTLSNSNLELVRSGTGLVDVFDLNLKENYIENTSNNAFIIGTTNRGYAKFDSTTGLVIPYGTTAERPSSPETGDTRWNTELDYLEIFNGVQWQRGAGEGESVTVEVLQELTDIYTLILG